MSTGKRLMRKIRQDAAKARAETLRCPGCAAKGAIVIIKHVAVCKRCGHKPARDLYA